MKKIIIAGILSCALAVPSIADVSWEMGMGSNYGGLLGLTANNKISDEVELYGGLALVGAVVGARYYINENVRINANYGTQGYIIKESQCKDEIEYLHGFNLGMDYVWDNGMVLGLMYHVASNESDKTREMRSEGYTIENDTTARVNLSLGYRF
jgi:hypothetical protein